MKKTFLIKPVMAFTALTIAFVLFSFRTPEKQSYKIGDTVTDFSIKNTKDGKPVSMSNYPTARGFVVVFTCNHCPFAKKYEERIMELDKKYASLGFPVIAISPNDPSIAPEDSYAELGKRAKEKGYTFPYAFDESQKVAQAFGATKTPHAFVVSREKGGKLVLKYMGAIDDNTDDAKAVTKHYVSDAIEAIISGKPVAVTETKSVGCSIKWKQG